MTLSYLGLDLGTSGLKGALWSDEGTLLGEAEAGYPVEQPRAGWAQTPVERWQEALEAVVTQLAGALRATPVAGVGIVGQMHGLVLTDDRGRALAPALLWSDARAVGAARRWRGLPEGLRARLANPIAPGMTGPLLAWAAEDRPELVQRAAVALLPKDALRCLLVPSPVTDRSDASATLLWDAPADDWSREVMEAVGLPARLLPEVVTSARVVGTTDWLHETVGAARDVPVVAGAGDTPAARLALGADAGILLNLGSGGQVLVPSGRPVPVLDPVTHTYADALEGWYWMAAVQNAGLALDWVCRMLDLSWEDLFTAAASAAPGAGGVSFLPFLHGERGGVASPDARAGWVGAGARTGRADLARAAVEGVVFTLRRAVELLPVEDAHAPVTLTGGGGRSPLVQQLLADVLGRPVHRRHLRSVSATGAALLAARGTGAAFPSDRDPPTVTEPSPQSQEHQGAYARWVRASRALDARQDPPPGG